MSKKNKSMRALQSIRGMHDILPQHTPAWQDLEDRVRHLFAGYGYAEIRMPLVEMSALFSRSIGEVTDIVEKEMYSFEDRNGELLSLRPEGTASCARAGIQHGLFHNQRQRLWYMGPMFRRERPQKGRYRQFHQIGVEAFGIEGPDIDAELIFMTARFWKELGLQSKDVRLELNSLGSLEARLAYREKLVTYFSQHHDLLNEESKRRLNTNPLRILDSKNPALKDVIAQAPSLLDHLDDASNEHFTILKAMLDDAGVEYVVNPQLVRGLDYYSRTVFEWKTDLLGAQGTVCAGGRYDGLVTQLGGRATPGCGFAMGVERLLELREALGIEAANAESDTYLVLAGSVAQQKGLKLAEDLRDALPNTKLLVNCGGGSFKSQMKRADKSGAAYALILGEDEVAKQQITVKPLRTQDEQQTMAWSELAAWLENRI